MLVAMEGLAHALTLMVRGVAKAFHTACLLDCGSLVVRGAPTVEVHLEHDGGLDAPPLGLSHIFLSHR